MRIFQRRRENSIECFSPQISVASACSFGAQSAASASEAAAAAAAAGGEEDLWTVWGKIINDWDANGGRRSRQMPQIKVRDFHIKKLFWLSLDTTQAKKYLALNVANAALDHI